MTVALTVLLGLAYAVSAWQAGQWWDLSAGVLLDLGASHGPAVAAGQSWRLFSAFFLHGGLPHLAFNALALWQLGRALEPAIGGVRLTATLLLAGGCGFLASLLWHPDGVSIGASGGIFGLLAGWAVLAWQRLPADDPDAIRQRRAITFTVLLALGLGLLIPNVDHAAHLGGLAAGLLLAKRRLGGFFASAVAHAALAACLLAAPVYLPPDWADSFRERQAFAAEYRAFATEDAALNAEFAKLAADVDGGRLDAPAAIARIDRELLPRLRFARDRWRADDWRTPRLAAEARRWREYASLRHDGATVARDAFASRDAGAAQGQLKRAEEKFAAAARLAAPDANPPPGSPHE